MLRVKPGVRLSDAQAMAVLINVAVAVYGARDLDCRITSGTDRPLGRAGMGLHPKGRALDFGIKYNNASELLPLTAVEAIAVAMRTQLGSDFDVVVEYDRVHIHAEYDPKTPVSA